MGFKKVDVKTLEWKPFEDRFRMDADFRSKGRQSQYNDRFLGRHRRSVGQECGNSIYPPAAPRKKNS